MNEKGECDEPSVGLKGESDREASEREEANDVRNKERQINTCPQTCKHTVRKGIKPIKCVGWVNCAMGDMPKRRTEEGRSRNGVRRRPGEQWKKIKEYWIWDKRTKKIGAGRRRRRAGGRDWGGGE